jgi:hypothetical protein
MTSIVFFLLSYRYTPLPPCSQTQNTAQKKCPGFFNSTAGHQRNARPMGRAKDYEEAQMKRDLKETTKINLHP